LSSHGGLHDAELEALGLRADEILDLSVNVNPYGPSPRVLEAIRAARVDRYPDPTGLATRRQMGARLDVDPASLVVAAGAVELIWLLARVVAANRRVLIAAPTFSEMAAGARAAGAEVIEHRDVDSLRAVARSVRPALIYVCTPNNPTGAAVDREVVDALAAVAPTIVDESFLSMSDDHAELRRRRHPACIRLRSLTKDHALPGLRVGYAIAGAELAARLEAARPPWSVSAPVAAAAVACLDEDLGEMRRRWLADRDALAAALPDAYPSRAPFLLVPVACSAAELRLRLLRRHHILVRDAGSFGLPDHIRVGARPGVAARLAAALAQERPSCPPVP
jgi:histidinol-phosphate/aromatic aminotransferase/cobyric acid decarboxylase-like protein